jgi:hypothetical protein
MQRDKRGNTDSGKPTAQPCPLVSKPTIYRINLPDMNRPRRAVHNAPYYPRSLGLICTMLFPVFENKRSLSTTPRNQTKPSYVGAVRKARFFLAPNGSLHAEPILRAPDTAPIAPCKARSARILRARQARGGRGRCAGSGGRTLIPVSRQHSFIWSETIAKWRWQRSGRALVQGRVRDRNRACLLGGTGSNRTNKADRASRRLGRRLVGRRRVRSRGGA